MMFVLGKNYSALFMAQVGLYKDLYSAVWLDSCHMLGAVTLMLNKDSLRDIDTLGQRWKI